MTRCTWPSRTTSRPSFQVLVPVVTATRSFEAMFFHFCSREAVEKWNALSCHTPTIGATCGRPSARTDVNQ